MGSFLVFNYSVHAGRDGQGSKLNRWSEPGFGVVTKSGIEIEVPYQSQDLDGAETGGVPSLFKKKSKMRK